MMVQATRNPCVKHIRRGNDQFGLPESSAVEARHAIGACAMALIPAQCFTIPCCTRAKRAGLNKRVSSLRTCDMRKRSAGLEGIVRRHGLLGRRDRIAALSSLRATERVIATALTAGFILQPRDRARAHETSIDRRLP